MAKYGFTTHTNYHNTLICKYLNGGPQKETPNLQPKYHSIHFFNPDAENSYVNLTLENPLAKHNSVDNTKRYKEPTVGDNLHLNLSVLSAF